MSIGWSILIIVIAGGAGIGAYIVLVGSETVRGADRDLDHDRARRARDE
jgi:hypothetical protein